MNRKVCKACGRELPWTDFRLTKGDVRAATCNACIAEKRAQTRYERAQVGGVKPLPFPTPTSTAKTLARSCA